MDNLQPYKISLDFYIRKIITVNAKQLDDKSRIINITCTENGKKFFVDSSTLSAFVRYKKSDGYSVLNQINILSDGTVNLELTQQMLAVEGRHLVDIMLINKSELEVYTSSISVEDDDNGNVTVIEKHTTNVSDISVEEILNAISENGISVLSTMSFYINTEGVAIDGAEIESSYEYNALIEGLGKMVAVDKRLVELEQNVVDSVVKCNNATDSANQAALSANQAALKAQLATQNANAVVSTKADSIVSTSSGEVVTTTDSANAKPKNIKLFGKGTQRQFEGNQLFDASKFTTTTIGNCTITNNGDGSLTISGSGELTENINFAHMYSHEETMELLKEGALNLAGSPLYPYCFVALYYGNMANSKIITLDLNTQVSKEILAECLDDACRLQIGFYGNVGGTIKGGTIKPMLYQDGDGTWEPFVGGEQSPSMNYPQIPVFHGESGSIEGKILSSNVVDYYCSSKRFIKNDNGKYDVTTNGSGYHVGGWYHLKGKLLPNVQYTVECFGLAQLQLVVAVSKDGMKTVDRYCAVHTCGYDNAKTFILTEDEYDYVYMNLQATDKAQAGTHEVWYSFVVGNEVQNWQPYTEQPFTALTPNGLRGVPLGTTIPDAIKNSPIHMSGVYWDKAEGQYYIADTKNENGKNVQRIFKEQLLDFNAYMLDSLSDENSTFFYVGLPRHYSGWGNEFICDIVSPKMNLTNVSFVQNGGWLNPANPTVLYIRLKKDSGITTLEEFKEYLTNNEVYVTLILPDPITTDPTQEELDQYNSLVMNYPITNVVNDAGAFQEVTYIADTKNYIFKIEKKHEEDIQTLKNAILSLGGNV